MLQRHRLSLLLQLTLEKLIVKVLFLLVLVVITMEILNFYIMFLFGLLEPHRDIFQFRGQS